jgi:hypothetical protein
LQVPMFVNEKDIIKIDTKTKSYITRVWDTIFDITRLIQYLY